MAEQMVEVRGRRESEEVGLMSSKISKKTSTQFNPNTL